MEKKILFLLFCDFLVCYFIKNSYIIRSKNNGGKKMTGGKNAEVERCVDRYRLHIHRFAKGTYPEAAGYTESLPVNRCFMPLANPSGEKCYLEDDEQHFTLEAGKAYFIPVNYPVRLRLDEDLTFVSIQFTLELFEGIDVFSAFNNICELPAQRWKSIADNAFSSKNPPLAGAQISALVFEFSSTLMQNMTEREWHPVTKFAEFQQELAYVYSNRKKLARLTVTDLANVRNFSREYFTRSFSRISGVSPKQFLTDLLLNEVKRRLARDEVSIKEISYSLGFSSEFYFSKFCRKHMGLSPKQYRDKYPGK